MKLSSAVLAAALLVTQGCAASLGLRAKSTFARNWLRFHGPAPQQDELADLRAENPEAYAIVNALLTKRSLGLLDPKHPSASFSAPPAAQQDVPTGPNAFAAFATPAPSTVSAAEASTASADAYPEVAAPPKQHDWLNWRPADSATSDDAMVKNVLGAVGNLMSGKAGRSSASSASPAIDSSSTDVPVATVSTNAASSSSSSTSSGWGDVFNSMQGAQRGLGGKPLAPIAADAPPVQQQAEAAPVKATAQTQEDTSAQGFDLKNDLIDTKAVDSSSQSGLASFSWGEDAPKDDTAATPSAPQPQQRQQQQMMMNVAAAAPVEVTASAPAPHAPETPAPAPKKETKNSLMAWLGSGGAALRPKGQETQAVPANQDQPTQKPAQEENPYLAMMS